MAVFALVPAGDLKLDSGTFSFTEGPDFIRQKLSCRFKFFVGEWFLDQREGIPYYQHVLVKNPRLELIRSLFKKVILTTPGVSSVVNLDLFLDASARTLSCSFQARLANGGVITVQPTDNDFVVDLTA